MTAHDPLHVEFVLPDDETARQLDLAIARSGGDPDRWLAEQVESERLERLASVPARLDRLAAAVQESARTVVPGSDGSGENADLANPAAGPGLSTAQRAASPRPTRLTRPSDEWRRHDRRPA